MQSPVAEHILFLTGKLAQPALQRVLQEMQPTRFTYEIRNIGLSVAALMTADMIQRRLENPGAANRVIVPGLCGGDLTGPAAKLGVPIERGPKDLKDIPGFFGQKGFKRRLDEFDVRIFAEIVDAPRLDPQQIADVASRYVAEGADVIDVGCLPGHPFDHLEASVEALKAAGYTVSIDSVDPDELLRGARAGADYLLSLKESTLAIAEEVTAVPVLIPETAGDLASLYRAMDHLLERGKPFIADSILDPLNFGFTESLIRYRDLRRRYPSVEIMMGTGNLTELTDADTAGINALLLGIMSELNIHSLLATQVSGHARRTIAELDFGRRLIFAARADNALPRGYDPGLLVAHDKRPFPYSEEELRELGAGISDPSYRVQVSQNGIHVFNRDGFWTGRDPYVLYPHLSELSDDAPHAFYLGVELAKAQIAWQLGKRYEQDVELDWQRGAAQLEPLSAAAVHQFKAPGVTRSGKIENVKLAKSDDL